MSMQHDFSDEIYEASVIPENWQTVCEKLANQVGAFGASVFNIAPDHRVSFISSPSAHDIMVEFSKSPYRLQNQRPARALKLSPNAFVRDLELMSEEELALDPVYLHFMKPAGLRYAAGCAVAEPSGHIIVFDIEKHENTGGFTERDMMLLESFRADLTRSALLTSRLAFQDARNMTAALSMVGLPAAVLGDTGKTLAMNGEMEELYPRIRTGLHNHLSLADAEADKLLQNGLASLQSGAAPAVQSIPLAAGEGFLPLVIHLLPVRRRARDIFSRSAVLLVATPVGMPAAPDVGLLSGLFDLTPGEAKVARGIAIGQTPIQISDALSLSIETVRSYLKRIYVKTGVNRQAELVALLSGLSIRNP